jgi:hypothetical protein
LKVIPPALKLISKKEVRDLIRGVRNGWVHKRFHWGSLRHRNNK